MSAILIVDDQPLNREYLVTLLGYFGHHMSEAGNGSDALKQLRSGKTDLVIADLLIPTMDGYAFLKQLRNSPANTAMPVMLYSAAAYEPQSRAMAESFGVQHFLTKPAEPAVMLAAVNWVLGKTSATVSSRSMDPSNSHLSGESADPIAADAVVYLVEDDDLQRRFLSLLITEAACNLEVFSNAEDFLEAFKVGRPCCLVLDVQLPKLDGLQLLEILRSRGIQIPVILLTGYSDTTLIIKAMRLDAMDFVEKPVDRNVLLSGVYRALRKESVKYRENADGDVARKRMASLTPRERELVQLLILGKSSKVIAAQLNISVKTVSHHRAHVMAKTGAANAADLVRMCIIPHSQ